jgi:enoyl-CoA hydratase/carnithine racemase
MRESPAPDVDVCLDGPVATVEIQRPPHNFFDLALVQHLADAFEALDADRRCLAIVLAAQGTAFCAGANFAAREVSADPHAEQAFNPIYAHALRLFACGKPIVAAVHGPAIGGGLGLALVADFRVACAEARFAANFTRLGFHPGFGLSVTLPRLVGPQQASLLFLTGRRIGGEEALRIGLVDALVSQDRVRAEAARLAREIATSAPIAVQATRATLRHGLLAQLRSAIAHESALQQAHLKTADFREGVAAMAARREPRFTGE